MLPDERVRSAQIDLDYARNYYGEEAVPGYAEAITRAQGQLGRAFTIRQELDDDIPEDEPTQRRMLTELLALTDAASARLQEQSDALDALRAQEANAPQAIGSIPSTGRVVAFLSPSARRMSCKRL